MIYLKSYNESVRDMMKPKSEKEIDEAFEKIADKVTTCLMEYHDYTDYTEAREWAYEHRDRIIDILDRGLSIINIVNIIMTGWSE